MQKPGNQQPIGDGTLPARRKDGATVADVVQRQAPGEKGRGHGFRYVPKLVPEQCLGMPLLRFDRFRITTDRKKGNAQIKAVPGKR